MRAPQVLFGGPDAVPGVLRDALEDAVRAVPAGGEIDWVTYYFRDRTLAEALVAARERGVRVRVTLEGRPRTWHANDIVATRLRAADGLGSDLRLAGGWLPDASQRPKTAGLHDLFRPRLHEKLYVFSHPEPVAFVGSFNPSGDRDEQAPEVIDAIGDQDRGHNLLVAFRDPALVAGLRAHARRVHANPDSRLGRFGRSANEILRAGATQVHFLPRTRRHPLVERLAHVGRGDRVRFAASHLNGATAARTLLGLARRGARVEIVAETTERRVPVALEQKLSAAGVVIARYAHADGLPMHCKIVWIDTPAGHEVAFGSFNWTERSLRLNREIAVLTRDERITEPFEARWQVLSDEAGLDSKGPRAAAR